MLVYKATFPNGKAYVGKTVNSLNHRKGTHYSSSKNKTDNITFHEAIREYGRDNVKWEVLEDNIVNHKELLEREKYNIIKYDTYYHEDSGDWNKGYNRTIGGQCGPMGYVPTEEAKQKQSKALKGRIISEETRKRISETMQGYNKGNTIWRGRHHTEESKKKMSEASKGKIPSEETRNKLREILKGRIISEETKQKMSDTRNREKNIKGSPCELVIRKMQEINTGTPRTEETRKKISEARKGYMMPEDTKEKLRQANLGKHPSEETRRKLSLSKKGNKNNLGNKASEETKQKMRESQAKRRNKEKDIQNANPRS